MSTDDLADDLLRSAARLSRWASRHAAHDLPWAQARVLSLVEELGPARITTLAAADDTSQPTMTTQVQRLEAEGFVTRSSDPADARASLVELTPSGTAALAAARRARARTLEPVLTGLDADPARVRAAVDLLVELVEATRTAAVPEPAGTAS
ncbi:MarR family winged helix-turn-helix transcriptional regulator [Phycicoccus sonneratiae]|uniref:MarR family winged helix-turn-helix transcriptional regulator n=1 Tax=Phycicoccus sonneratiae TaxID=2807628 RepID=UPI0027DBB1A6|nr:MarR family transcriptional regulator [Phycicoccus sonneraticus]